VAHPYIRFERCRRVARRRAPDPAGAKRAPPDPAGAKRAPPDPAGAKRAPPERAGGARAAAPRPTTPRDSTLPLAEFRRLDANSEEAGVPIVRLMANAGKALAAAAVRLARGTHIVFLCGKGNNGGDGYAAAVHLTTGRDAQRWRDRVLCVTLGPPAGPESRHYHDALAPAARETWRTFRARRTAPRVALVVDCLLGSGIDGEPRGAYADAIRWMNRQRAPVLACDVPSGLGTRVAVRPRETVTFHARKEGMTAAACGRISVVDIGIPRRAAEVGVGDLRAGYVIGAADAHKGDHGHVLIVGGGPFTGAPHYAGMAAYRAGADLVTLWTPARAARVIESWGPDLLVHDGPGDHLTPSHVADVAALMDRCNVMLIGVGLGSDDATRAAVATVLDEAARRDLPVVVDADGLDAVTPDWLARHGRRTVLTPHAREFEDLVGRKATDAAVRAYAAEHRVTLVRKGAVDVVTDGTTTRLCRRGHPAMAVGGTGDVLAGTIAALVGRGAAPFDAACAATYLVGAAGEVAADVWSHGLTASDVIDAIPQILHRL
jgi:NAD(P)H-hydrate epimerase